MKVGDQVTSEDAPGAVGTVTRRIDTDDGVILLVNWTTALGQTSLTYHDERNLQAAGQEGSR